MPSAVSLSNIGPELLIVRIEYSEVRTKKLRTERKDKRLTVKKNAKKKLIGS